MNKLVIVIFGASGDLTKRKLMPALYTLYSGGRLPEGFSILGIGRTEYTDARYQEYIMSELSKFVASKEQVEDKMRDFCSHLHYQTLDPAEVEGYHLLDGRLQEFTGEKKPDNLLFYLATPPSLYGVIPLHLKAAGLNRPDTRIIVEKPFGYDLESARKLNSIYASVFKEHQIYRIDHFLGKETAQNILAFRFANGIFEPLWNRNYIDYVEITAVENLGIEGRGGFYEGAGALRDMVQNHLLNLAAFVAMECPASFDAESIRDEVAKVLQCLRPMDEKTIDSNTMRAQYSESGNLPAYRSEKNVAADSSTETFAAMKFFIENWRWGGVPFYLYTGKRLPERKSEVIINFKSAPVQMFVGQCSGRSCNKLTMRIQPDEGVWLSFGLKIPGAGYEVAQVSMDFNYSSMSGANLPDAYERLLLDAMSGDATLYARSDALEASWKFIDPILNRWKERGADGLEFYPAGSDGPEGARKMRLEHSSDSCPIRFSASAKNGNENRKM